MRYHEIIHEAFSNTVPFHWFDRSNEDLKLIQAEFQIGDGHFIVQFRMPYYNPNYWELTFTRNGDLELSNTGNAMLVLSTVMQIAREFIEAQEPRFITFAASVKEPSRSKLYPKLMSILMREFPQFKADPVKHGQKHTSYTVQQPPKPYVAPPPPPPKEPYDGPEVSFDELEKMLADLDAQDRRKRAA